MKILVISFAGNGDTLFATPMIHELRANFPEARIDVLVRWAGARGLLEGNPHVNTVYQNDLVKSGLVGSLKFLRGLRAEGYDISLNTHPQSRIHYRAVTRFIGARVRASHRYECSGPLDAVLVNRTIPQDYSLHAVENNLALLPLVGAKAKLPTHEYELYLSPEDTKWAEDVIAANRLKGRVAFGIHVGSGGTKNLALRRWPVPNFVALIRRLIASRDDLTVLLFGGPDEVDAHELIKKQCDSGRVIEVKSKSLRQAAALLKHCRGFLSVDTVLMHLAAAVKVPGQIVIETPTWNKPIEPYGQKFVLVPNPSVGGRNLDYYRYDGRAIKGTAAELASCMASVTVDAVWQAILSMKMQ